MNSAFVAGIALGLFVLGLRLSAFFSGSETGFYRVSRLRLAIDADSGDPAARRLLWFTQNPGYFVATTLVGNNVANYLTTLAIGMFAVTLLPNSADFVEIVFTLCVAPLVFVFGELIPKSLYYRAPLHFLRRDLWWFVWCHRLFLPLTFPLTMLARLFERFGSTERRELESVLGRRRLEQVLSQGHREGLLTDIQSHLVDGLMGISDQTIVGVMLPIRRVPAVLETAPRQEVLEVARQHGLNCVCVRKSTDSESIHGYVRVIDVEVCDGPWRLRLREMPRVSPTDTRLEVLIQMRSTSTGLALIVDADQVIGVINERAILEQLFRNRPATAKSREL